MRKNALRTLGGGIALALPVALGFGGVAAADTGDASGTITATTSVQDTTNTSAHAQGTVYYSNGDWYYNGFRDGRYVDSFNLSAALNLSSDNGEVYSANGDWYFQGEMNGEYFDSFNLSAALNLSFDSNDSGYQDDGLLGGLLGSDDGYHNGYQDDGLVGGLL